MKLKEKKVFDQFNSSAIKSLTFVDQTVKIVFQSSPKEYNYSVINTNFEELVEKCVKNSESVGKLVHKANKEGLIQIIEDKEEKLNKTVV